MTGAPYAPFMEARTAHPPGLMPLDPAAWLTCDPDYAAQMAARDALLAAPDPEVVAALPEAAAALAELRALLLDDLAERPEWRMERGACRRPDGARVALDLDTLTLAGRLCQEDFLLMAPGEPEFRLVAGVLCFPSRWSLSEKLGRALTAIHGPVPIYDATMARRVNRVFAALAPERPLMRVNWLVAPTDRLRLAQREAEKAPHGGRDGGRDGRFWLRTERQTLRRLTITGAVVFTVKTTLTPLAALTQAQRGALGARLAEWPEADIAYRGGAAQHAAALAALDWCA